MKKTPTIAVFIATSVNGFIARQDGDVAWLEEFDPLGIGEDGGFAEFFNQVDVLVMGRNTFEKVRTFNQWPYGQKPVIVMSTSLKEIPNDVSGNITLFAGEPTALIEFVMKKGYTQVYLDGGRLIQSFLQAGLVNQLTITRIPILLGRGIPLFGHINNDIRLKLIKTTVWQNGFIGEKYAIENP